MPHSNAQLLSQDFWSKLVPELSALPHNQVERLEFSDETRAGYRKLLIREGYVQMPPLLPPELIQRLKACVQKLHAEGLPPVFGFVYADFWELFMRMQPWLAYVLGDGYRQLPDFWVWRVDHQSEDRGWKPHRDKPMHTLDDEGMPLSVTTWVPLSDATTLNGCMYLLPAHYDPMHPRQPTGKGFELQDVRALPADAGSILCWNQKVFHWGGRSSGRAPEPRISVAFEFQRGTVAPYNTPLMDPLQVPDFQTRLRLIAKQLLQYKHMYGLAPHLEEFARGQLAVAA